METVRTSRRPVEVCFVHYVRNEDRQSVKGRRTRSSKPETESQFLTRGAW